MGETFGWRGILVLGVIGFVLFGILAFINPLLVFAIPVLLVVVMWRYLVKRNKRRDELLFGGDVDTMSQRDFAELLETIFMILEYKVSERHRYAHAQLEINGHLSPRHRVLETGNPIEFKIRGPEGTIYVYAVPLSDIVNQINTEALSRYQRYYGATEGWFLTNARFGEEAKADLKRIGFTFIDGNMLASMIKRARKKEKEQDPNATPDPDTESDSDPGSGAPIRR